MSNKRELAFAVAFFLLSTAFADVLTWRAHEGQQYEAKVTVKESVIGLDTVTTKPALVTVNVYKQEDAAAAAYEKAAKLKPADAMEALDAAYAREQLE